MRVKCLVQEHNAMSPQGLEPGALALESSAIPSVADPDLELRGGWGGGGRS